MRRGTFTSAQRRYQHTSQASILISPRVERRAARDIAIDGRLPIQHRGPHIFRRGFAELMPLYETRRFHRHADFEESRSVKAFRYRRRAPLALISRITSTPLFPPIVTSRYLLIFRGIHEATD
jgi:hypothetical protein